MKYIRQLFEEVTVEDVVDSFETDFVRNSVISILSVIVFWLVVLLIDVITFGSLLVLSFVGVTIIFSGIASISSISTLRKEYEYSSLQTRLEVLYPFSVVWTVSSIIITFIPTAFLFGEFFWSASWYQPTIAGAVILSGLSLSILTNIYCSLVSYILIQNRDMKSIVKEEDENSMDVGDDEKVESSEQPALKE